MMTATSDDLDFLRRSLARFRDRIAGKRIFVSGGTGFFGKWLLTAFLAAGFDARLTVLSRDPKRFLRANPRFRVPGRLDFVAGEIRDFRFPAGEFDLAIHAATPASARMIAEEPEEMYDLIVSGTGRFLDFAERAGVRRLLFVSSGAVYGTQPPEVKRIPEEFPCAPVNAYGRGKLAAEQLCTASPVPTLTARCFAFLGPGLPLDLHFAAGNFLRDALVGGPIRITGDGRPLRSYLYAADLALWLWTILLDGRPGVICNVGSPESVSIAELARLTAGCFDPVPAVEVLGVPDPAVPPPRYVPDTARAKAELGLVSHFPLREAIARTAHALLQQPSG